ncbi:High-affnity carbon uptake protein Hat/HatR [Labilithrix luteola]|uniref:High-affnity carbon uptake protein Hat/HatR n=1 Tax=Labilithrix luteola TaxID=1391654 RepID=A0A0K1QFL3_9BACT|nr:High-affnity carbon uptake protein Hat/HatR [Labilithrix luteola]
MVAKTELRARFRLETGDYVAALTVSRDGRLCVAGLGDGRVLGLDLSSGKELFSTVAHPGVVLGVALSPAGDSVATCGQEEAAKLWTTQGKLLRELPSGGAAWVEHVAWAPRGERLATAAGKKVRVWTSDGEPIVETEALASTITGLAWRADGNALAATCYGGVDILPFTPGMKARHLAWKGSLISVAWSPDAKVIACGSQDCSVHFWRLATGQDSQMSGYPFKPKALAWDSASRLLATSGDATVTVWDFHGKGPEGTRPLQLESHKGACTCLAFSPRKGVLASGSQDTSVLLWEPRKGTRPTRFAFLDDEITGLAWHPEHHTLVAGDASGTLCAWEVA